MPHTRERAAVATFKVLGAGARRKGPMLQRASANTCMFARRLVDAGRAHEALRLLDRETEAAKNDAEFQFVLGRAALRVGDRAGAQRAFSRAIALSPQDADVYRWLAQLISQPPRNDVESASRKSTNHHKRSAH